MTLEPVRGQIARRLSCVTLTNGISCYRYPCPTRARAIGGKAVSDGNSFFDACPTRARAIGGA